MTKKNNLGHKKYKFKLFEKKKYLRHFWNENSWQPDLSSLPLFLYHQRRRRKQKATLAIHLLKRMPNCVPDR
jgi:hypothetical protein